MKFIVNRDQLFGPLQQIVSVIEKRQTMPILSNVLLNVQDDQIVMTGTDTEIQLITKLSCNTIIRSGITTIPARKLLDICRLLPNQSEIQFELMDDKMKILSGKSRFSLGSLPSEHFPEFNEADPDYRFSISSAKLKKALDKTLFCMANQDVRFYLNGLLLHISNSQLKFVASDGHRLAVYEEVLDQPSGHEARIIIPRKAVQELHRLLDDTDTDVLIQFSPNFIRIDYQSIIFSSKLIDAKFPDFGKVFSQSFHSPMTLTRQTFKEALTRVAILSNEKYKGVTFDLTQNLVKLSAFNPEHDEAEEEVNIEFNGTSLSISFNAQYILDALSNLDTDDVVMSIASNASSCFIEDQSSQTYRFVIMPMRL